MRFLCLIVPMLLATPVAVLAQSIEPVAAQGPSSRTTPAEPSAYQLQEPSSPLESSAPTETKPQPSGRRPQFGRSTLQREKPSGAASERSTAMLERWARGSGMTAAAALAFVVGLFMLLAWVVKKGMPQSSQMLPSEAIRILGRFPLGSRQFGHLLHLGNKLVLVSVNQNGVEKLAEIDDPQEVVRLVALCSKTSGKGSQKEFEEIFGQFASEKTASGFLGSETSTTKGGRQYA